jgi:hypothetical protein
MRSPVTFWKPLTTEHVSMARQWNVRVARVVVKEIPRR